MRITFNEIKELCHEYGYELSDKDISLNVTALNIISTLIHDKLSCRELFEAYDFLSDLIQGKKPIYAVVVPKQERISVQKRVMEDIPQTAGKLTQDEKEVLAFCVYYITCIRVLDEKSMTTFSGIVDFTSIENVLRLYNETKQRNPELFSVKAVIDRSFSDDYGYSIENPIMVSSVRMAYSYLNALRYNGKPINYERRGTAGTYNGDYVDSYLITAKHFLKTLTWELFIDAYAVTPVVKPPKGFTLQN